MTSSELNKIAPKLLTKITCCSGMGRIIPFLRSIFQRKRSKDKTDTKRYEITDQGFIVPCMDQSDAKQTAISPWMNDVLTVEKQQQNKRFMQRRGALLVGKSHMCSK